MKQIPIKYWATLPVRFLLYSAKASFDTLSVEAYAKKLKITQLEARKYVLSQAIASIGGFVGFSLLSIVVT
jgi:hypothetical protein